MAPASDRPSGKQVARSPGGPPWKKFDSRPRNQVNGMFGLPMNGRRTQPICAPTSPKTIDPDPEDRLDVPAQDPILEPAPAGPAGSGLGPVSSASPRRRPAGGARSGDIQPVQRLEQERQPEARPAIAKTTTLNRTMNG